MRKEVIIAVLLGLSLGLVVTFGVYTANQAVKEKKTEQTIEIVQTSASPSPKISLTIDSPENNLVVNKNKIEVSGRATNQAVIAVFSEESEVFTQADDEGFFSATFPLVKGSNKITVKSIDSEDQQEERKLMIVYTTALK